jgi:hypothetical protein
MRQVAVALTTLLLILAFVLPVASSASAASWRWCGSGSEATWQPNFGRWFIQNDAWNGSHGPQRICANSYHYWRAVSKQPNLGGAVETFPDSQKVYGPAANLPMAPFSKFRVINSRFSIVVPHGKGLSFNAAYDTWYGKGWDTTSEVMMWFYTVNVGMGGSSFLGKAHLFGQTFNVYKYDGKPPEFVFRLDHNVTHGTAHIQAATQWLVNRHQMKASEGLTAIPFGFEIRSTGGAYRTFGVNSLDIYTARK